MKKKTGLQNGTALPGLPGRGAYRLLVLAALICAIGMLAACFRQVPSPGDTETMTDALAAAQEEKEEKRFSFRTTDLNGNPVDESMFEGYDLVMLNFWAYWCSPCIREIPELEKLHQNYPNLLLLGVIVDDSDMEETVRILESAGATYPVLYPEGDLATLAANCQYVPTTFFLRPNGMMTGEPVIGSNDYDGWKKTVDGLLR